MKGRKSGVKLCVGETFTTNEGGRVEVLEYRNSLEVLAVHLDDHRHEFVAQANNLRRGTVKNPFFKSVFGVGYIGCGSYRPTVGRKTTPEYESWRGMLLRSYSPSYILKYPTYTDVSVCPEWHNFQVFAEWWHRQWYANEEGFDLDKDLILTGNKIYSQEYCSFVPHSINKLTNLQPSSRGFLPLGVTQSGLGWQARVSMGEKYVVLGHFTTVQEASRVYREAKESYVKSMADKYKSVLHPKVYSNLMAWEVPEERLK